MAPNCLGVRVLNKASLRTASDFTFYWTCFGQEIWTVLSRNALKWLEIARLPLGPSALVKWFCFVRDSMTKIAWACDDGRSKQKFFSFSLLLKQKINLSELEDGNDGVGIVLVDADSGGAIENPFNDINKLPYDVVTIALSLILAKLILDSVSLNDPLSF